MNSLAAARPRLWPRRAREALVTAHIMISVGLLGDSAGFLAVAIRAYTAEDPATATTHVEVLKMFSQVFGIPLSFGSLLTGIALGLGTKWGVFRYPWVVLKLALVVSVMAVGGLMIGPSQTAWLTGTHDARWQLIVAGAYDVVALGLATALSVFKPGLPFRRQTSGLAAGTPRAE